MSRFNTEELCDACEDLERKHPEYKQAQDAEHNAVMQGNMNFPGVGLPIGYAAWAATQRM